jgi:hypothetical protein
VTDPVEANAALAAAEEKLAAAAAERNAVRGALFAALAERGWRQLPLGWWEHPARPARTFTANEAVAAEQEAAAA